MANQAEGISDLPTSTRIAVLPGDGVGAEVTAAAVSVLKQVCEMTGLSISLEFAPIGASSLTSGEGSLPKETEELCGDTDAILVGAVGGPEWIGFPLQDRPEWSLLRLRRELDLYVNVRPVRILEPVRDMSPLRADLLPFDMLILREQTSGLYYGKPKNIRPGSHGTTEAVDTLPYTQHQIDRIIEFAFAEAQVRRNRVALVDKENVLATSKLWRQRFDLLAEKYPDVQTERLLVDNAAAQLVLRPASFDVIVTENLFGDVLSDEAGGLCGSIGLLPSASIGDNQPYLYEPVHGTAPEIAGQGIANPTGAILSVGLMMRYTFGRPDLKQRIEAAVEEVLRVSRTPDIWTGDTAREGTEAFTQRVLQALQGDRTDETYAVGGNQKR